VQTKTECLLEFENLKYRYSLFKKIILTNKDKSLEGIEKVENN